MTDNKQKPLYRVGVSRITGQDNKGDDILGKCREVGAVWARKNGKGAVLKFDILPAEISQGRAVIFLKDVE